MHTIGSVEANSIAEIVKLVTKVNIPIHFGLQDDAQSR
jgi:hypothetical protein